MNPLDSALFADENIAPEVVAGLRGRGMDVSTVTESDLAGASDVTLLERAASEKRVIITHDADFGLLAIRLGTPFFDVVLLRPGYISSSFVLDVVDRLRRAPIDVEPPFLVVAERRATRIVIRVHSEESRSNR